MVGSSNRELGGDPWRFLAIPIPHGPTLDILGEDEALQELEPDLEGELRCIWSATAYWPVAILTKHLWNAKYLPQGPGGEKVELQSRRIRYMYDIGQYFLTHP